MATNPADLLVQEYVACDDPERAEKLLETLVVEHAGPSIRKIIGYKLAFQSAAEAQAVEDVSSEVLADLLSRLRRIKNDGAASIEAVSSYAAVAARHACNEYLRRKCPNRHHLNTRLRYLLTTEKGLAMWEDGDSGWLCGFSRWQTERTPAVARERLDAWRDILGRVPHGKGGLHPADLAFTIFERFAAPIAFDDLVAIVAQIWGVEDPPAAPESAARDVRSGEYDPGARLDLTRWIATFWAQIGELPVAERLALLLNLRDAGGQAVMALLPLTGVAGIRQIAETLELPADELAAIWNRLPLDDPTIADRLGVNRQRVINLRRSARERLTRRMEAESQPGR